jgi:folate-dependent phosphoribosylglycinamide formyltransferase PurN
MKIIFACRHSPAAYYIAHSLAEKDLIEAIIIESGTQARAAKLRRVLRKSSIISLPITFLDLTSITLYSYLCNKDLKKHLLLQYQIHDFPKEIPKFYIDNINESSCLEFLRAKNPDILIVQGTSILKREVIAIPYQFILNIHGGIVPEYRNVHSDFWALLMGDYAHIGTSIIYLDEGIDSGDLALQSTIQWQLGDGILAIKRKNLKLAGQLILDAIHKAEQNKLPRQSQAKSTIGFFSTPTARNILALLVRTMKSKWFSR